jgi:hypothetical protein
MFKLTRWGYNWYLIFMFLSLEKTEPFLEDIHFPATIPFEPMRMYSREVVKNFARVDFRFQGTARHEVGSFFEQAYHELSSIIGKEEANQVADWGNMLIIDGQVSSFLSDAEFICRQLIAPPDALSTLQPESVIRIREAEAVYAQEVNAFVSRIGPELDAAQTQQHDDWEGFAIKNVSGYPLYANSINTYRHPLSYLAMGVVGRKFIRLITRIQETVPAEDFNKLDAGFEDIMSQRQFSHNAFKHLESVRDAAANYDREITSVHHESSGSSTPNPSTKDKVFKLTQWGMNWYRIFILLSIEKTEAFLEALYFPANLPIEPIRMYSRELIKNFARVDFRFVGRATYEVCIFFEEAYHELSSIIGKPAVDQLADWGNSLIFEGDLADSLSSAESHFWTLMKSPDALPTLPPESAARIREIHEVYRKEARAVRSWVHAAEAQPQDAWEAFAVADSSGGPEYNSDPSQYIHPFMYLHTMISNHEFVALIRSIQDAVPADDFRKLDTIIENIITKKAPHQVYKSLESMLAAAERDGSEA